MAAQPLLGTVPRRPREPRILDDFLQLRQRQLTQAAGPHEHRRMPIEVGGGEERCRLVLDQRLLLGLVRYPEQDDVAVALAAVRVDSVGSRVPEEDEGLAFSNRCTSIWTSSFPSLDSMGCVSRYPAVRPARPLPTIATFTVRVLLAWVDMAEVDGSKGRVQIVRGGPPVYVGSGLSTMGTVREKARRVLSVGG